MYDDDDGDAKGMFKQCCSISLSSIISLTVVSADNALQVLCFCGG